MNKRTFQVELDMDVITNPKIPKDLISDAMNVLGNNMNNNTNERVFITEAIVDALEANEVDFETVIFLAVKGFNKIKEENNPIRQILKMIKEKMGEDFPTPPPGFMGS